MESLCLPLRALAGPAASPWDAAVQPVAMLHAGGPPVDPSDDFDYYTLHYKVRRTGGLERGARSPGTARGQGLARRAQHRGASTARRAEGAAAAPYQPLPAPRPANAQCTGRPLHSACAARLVRPWAATGRCERAPNEAAALAARPARGCSTHPQRRRRQTSSRAPRARRAACPFAHKQGGERSARRDLRRLPYLSIPCEFAKQARRPPAVGSGGA
jgi:hypothetical protein